MNRFSCTTGALGCQHGGVTLGSASSWCWVFWDGVGHCFVETIEE